jgi:hypothetical protein
MTDRGNRLDAAIFAAELSGDTREVARLKRAKQMEGRMGHYDDKFRKAIEKLADGIAPAARELASFEAEANEAAEQGRPYPPKYYRDRRDAILGRVAYGESQARAALAEYRQEALTDARETRAAAEAGRDPQARIAEELERARLIGSSTNAQAFAEQASAALTAKQPRRAELLLSVAVDKGWKGGVELDPATGEPVGTLPKLRQSIEDAIDAAEPDRQSARSLEESVAANTFAFSQERVAVLARFGIGVMRDGSIGTGRTSGLDGVSEVAVASIGAKMRAHVTGTATPDGLMASTATGEYARAKANS